MPQLPPLPESFDRRAAMPIVERYCFLNHAAVAPICAAAAAEIERFAREARDHAYLTGHWYRRAEETRALAAALIQASPEEVAFVKNTSEGIAFVANGLAWRPGDEVISTAVEYPANVYPWMDLQKRCGVRHIMVPERNGRIDPEEIIAAITPRTRLASLSHVEYASGFRHDLAKISAACRAKGALFCVDAIQTCGALPVNVRAMGIDFLSADGHKWLLGPEGCGIFYCRKELLGALQPEIGWMNVVNSSDYANYDFTLRPDARRFECGSYNIPGVLALGAAIKLLLDVGIELVWARVLALTDQLCEMLAAKEYAVFSSRRAGEQSAIVSFTHPRHDLNKIVVDLEKQDIIVALRGGRLRASPHFYNTEDDLHRLVDALP